VQLSWSYALVNGVPTPLYQPAIVVPARAQAQVLGTVDLTSITYAKPSIVTGTVDLTTLTWGPGGTLDTLTVIDNIDGGGVHTCTFAAPSSPQVAVAQLVTTFGAGSASLNLQNQLVLSGAVLGTGGSQVLSGTALGELGMTAATTAGTPGALDGETILFSDDSAAGQTVTFSSPKPGSPADVLAKIGGATGIAADMYTAKNVLRLRSTTKGGASSLQVTGGTALTALGLSVMVAAAVGAESFIQVPHLGININFSPNTQGTFQVNTTYAWTTKAPKPSDSDIQARIADLDNSGYPYGKVYIISETDLVSSLARETMLDTQMVAEHALDRMKSAAFGFDVSETATNIRNTFFNVTTAWVDRFADGAYIVGGNIPGGGWLLRSTSWLGAMVDTFNPLYKDRGDRQVVIDAGVNGLPDVGGITRDESIDGTKLVDDVNGNGTSCNVLEQDSNLGYYFAGGYSSAPSTSKYCDSSTRNTMLRMGEIVASVLNRYQNDTELDTNADGTLAPESAEVVDSAIEQALEELVPKALQADVASVDTTVNFYSTKKLAASITGFNRVPVRSTSATVSPGPIATAQ